MRQLLQTVDPNLWMEISASMFGVLFLILVCWVYYPPRKSMYQKFESLPLDQD